MKLLGYFFITSAFLCNAYAGGSDKLESDFFDGPEVNIQISHAFGKEESSETFRPRGTVDIRSFKGPKFTAEQPDLSLQDLDLLKEVASEDGYYFVKFSTKGPSGVKSFRTFIPAKALLDSGLSDVLMVHLNPASDIYAISYSVARNDYFTAPHVLGNNRPPPTHFNTTVIVHYGEIGPVPDTAPYLEKLEQERISKERGDDTRDNRSFLAKYWMYILPVVILVLLSGASNPEEGGGR
ncbi:unnamed protein product [Allacma fusca]|uniref:ER membrane protein complex subunit 10 n=1 Tax=Allacma fusca TaxID=39272 RepID=A0A8J2K5G8_9HEXA|nr:unnamed protein product [Allacma fusca]